MKKDKLIINLEDPTIIDVNGKKYRMKSEKAKRIDGILHGDKVVFVPFDEVDEQKHNERIDYIVEQIQESVNREEILKEVLRLRPENELIKIEKLLKSGAKITRQRGCICLKIGGKGGVPIFIV
jgi:hypothetical protein